MCLFCLWLSQHIHFIRPNAPQYELINDINITVKIMKQKKKERNTHTKELRVPRTLCTFNDSTTDSLNANRKNNNHHHNAPPFPSVAES